MLLGCLDQIPFASAAVYLFTFLGSYYKKKKRICIPEAYTIQRCWKQMVDKYAVSHGESKLKEIFATATECCGAPYICS